jgi:hypothetical protein
MKIHKMIALVLLLQSPATVTAEILTPEQYIELEITVRSITLDKMREYMNGEDSGKNYKQQIKKAYLNYATTPGKHLSWGNKNPQKIDNWLQVNQDKKYELDQLTFEFEQLLQRAE